mgnify:CR=1 FL=1
MTDEAPKDITAPEEPKVDESEPKIEEDLPKPAKKTKYLFKIEPTLDWFPTCEGVTVDQMKSIRKHFNEF